MVGTLNKLIDSPNESVCLIIPEVAVVRDCDCNIISTYDLARSGFRHVQSRCGKYLFFYNKYGVFSFAAKEMGGVYYLPSAKQKLMTKMAHLSKKKVYTLKENEELLKTWHIALGHVNVRRLIAMFSGNSVDGMPRIEARELGKIPFHCETCAVMKQTRMSYRGMTGSRGEESIAHTTYGYYGSYEGARNLWEIGKEPIPVDGDMRSLIVYMDVRDNVKGRDLYKNCRPSRPYAKPTQHKIEKVEN